MAKIGVSKPYFAIYSNEGDTVSYSAGGVLGKATEVDVTINTSEDNNLYADNGIAETDRQFTDGTLTIGTDDLSPEVSKAILGAREQEITGVDGLETAEGEAAPKELIYDDEMVTPYLGVGFVLKGQKNNVPYWRAVVFPKVMFNVPDESATTQGESIEWQTPSLVGTILRDDSTTHMWKREATVDTEAKAEAYIKARLNITAAVSAASFSVRKTAASASGTGDKV